MLIPREVLFGNPERLSPRISPDGAHLAYIAPDGAGVLQVWLRAESGTGDKMLTADKKRGIRAYFWTHDGEQLIYMQDADGDENFHFYAVNINTDVVRDLTPFQGVRAEFVALSYKHPHEVLVALNLIDRSRLDVYRVNLKNGAVELDTENPGTVAGWVNDEDLRVRAALAFNAAGGKDLLYRPVDSAPWQTLRSWSPDDEGGPEGFSADGRRLYIMSNQHSNAIRLSVLDLESMQETVIAQDPEFDVSEVLVHPTTRDIQAVGFYRDKLEWQALDPAVAADLEVLAAGRAGEVRVVGRDIGDKVWIVACTSDDGPVYYHRYDRAAKTDTFLFSHKPALEGLALAKMKPVAFTSRDGLSLRGYLSLPPEPAAAMPLPTVLLVHGGPWGRDVWGFNSYAQWLANRGYAVLQVNFRGSTGYGRDFLNAGNREWGAKMHDDLIDAVNWIVAQGIADPAKVAIMGGSYGGYATLAGLTFTPGRIRGRRRYLRPEQHHDLAAQHPALLGADAGNVSPPRRRPRQRARVPRYAIAAVVRRPHQSAAPDRPGRERPPRQAGRKRADCRRDAQARPAGRVRPVHRRRPWIRPSGEQPSLQRRRRAVPGQAPRRRLRAPRRNRGPLGRDSLTAAYAGSSSRPGTRSKSLRSLVRMGQLYTSAVAAIQASATSIRLPLRIWSCMSCAQRNVIASVELTPTRRPRISSIRRKRPRPQLRRSAMNLISATA